MKLIFKGKEVILEEQDIEPIVYDETSFMNKEGKNILFTILEKCIKNESNLKFEKNDDISSFMEKLHDIIKNEFSNENHNI